MGLKYSSLYPKGDAVPDIPAIEYGCSSIMGTRTSQQDYYGTSSANGNDSLLAVVCDGMGGLSGGEIASRTTVETILGKYQGMPKNSSMPKFYQECVKETDLIIHNLEDGGKPMSAGTTLVTVSITGNTMYMCSVGDSRIYLIRGGKIKSLCREHNYGEMLKQRLSSGAITRREYENDTQRKDALTSYIGMGSPPLIDINSKPFQLAPDDMIVLCSDGLFKALTDEQILIETLRYKLDPLKAADNLTSQAMTHRKGAQDNTTAIVIHSGVV